MKSDKTGKKVFDVASSNKIQVDIGSRPMAAGHKPSDDPMVKKKANKEHSQSTLSHAELELQPLENKEQNNSHKQEEQGAKPQNDSPDSAPDSQTQTDSQAKEAKLDPVAIAMEREENLNKLIESKKYRVDIKESSSMQMSKIVVLSIAALAAIAAVVYVLLDAQIISNDISLPVNLFE